MVDKVYSEIAASSNYENAGKAPGRNFLHDWAKEHKPAFVQSNDAFAKHSPEMLRILKDGGAKEPAINKFMGKAKAADPYLIAVAKENGWILVTMENSNNAKDFKKGKIKIPDVCRKMDVKCMPLYMIWNDSAPDFVQA